MGSGGVGASARTGNHFHLACDSSEWSMMLRPLTTSVVLFMESTFFDFRVTISGKLCHKLPPPAFGGGGSCFRKRLSFVNSSTSHPLVFRPGRRWQIQAARIMWIRVRAPNGGGFSRILEISVAQRRDVRPCAGAQARMRPHAA